MKLYVFDLDGTLANIDHRLPYIQQEPPQWEPFFETCHLDTPVRWVGDLLNRLLGAGHVIIVSGRRECVREKTQDWLMQHGIFPDELLMRPDGNREPDEQIKLHLLNTYLAQHPQYAVEFIVEDRQRVVDMWRREGFNVLQCAAWQEWKDIDGIAIPVKRGPRRTNP